VGESLRILLASQSPRRAELLRRAGIPFDPGPAPGVDETPPPGLDPPAVARALAEKKARHVARDLPDRVVLAADTVVHVDGEVLGKPHDAADAARMLRALSGRRHRVATGVAVVHRGRLESGVETATVVFRALSPEEVEAYVAGGEPMDKAGAYALQGGAARFVTSLEGAEDAVVGLPIRLVRDLLGRLGLPSGSPAGR
jgi:septum formation protein